MYKILKLISGDFYVSKVIDETDQTMVLQNPSLIDFKFNDENQPIFRYIPWQLISKSQSFTVNKEHILWIDDPRTELLTAYKQICVSFTVMEEDIE
jgi:hypothetical protein